MFTPLLSCNAVGYMKYKRFDWICLSRCNEIGYSSYMTCIGGNPLLNRNAGMQYVPCGLLEGDEGVGRSCQTLSYGIALCYMRLRSRSGQGVRWRGKFFRCLNELSMCLLTEKLWPTWCTTIHLAEHLAITERVS